MHSTGIDRRTLLALAGAGAGLAMLPPHARAELRRQLYFSARLMPEGGYRASSFDGDGRAVFDVDLPARGHAFAVHPARPVVVQFARRPGTFMQVIDIAGTADSIEIGAAEGRHFYGHGLFAPDGAILYATENDYEAGRGVLGLYDARDGYRRIGEIPAHGIGPHDATLMADGTTIAVANGGVQTHPDTPRVRLNVPTMEPSLTYVDRRDGGLLGEVKLPADLHMLGIRHVAARPDGTVGIAMQYEGPGGDRVPLVALHRPGREAKILDAPANALRQMKNYTGSATFDSSGAVLAVSAPRGNVMTFWDVDEARFLSSYDIADGCGMAATGRTGEFLLSSGAGGVFVVDAIRGRSRRIEGAFTDAGHWDNHVMVRDA